jgi:hypothetical protein
MPAGDFWGSQHVPRRKHQPRPIRPVSIAAGVADVDAKKQPIRHSNEYSADSACASCNGIIRHESWRIKRNLNVCYAHRAALFPDQLCLEDHIILHAWGSCVAGRRCLEQTTSMSKRDSESGCKRAESGWQAEIAAVINRVEMLATGSRNCARACSRIPGKQLQYLRSIHGGSVVMANNVRKSLRLTSKYRRAASCSQIDD